MHTTQQQQQHSRATPAVQQQQQRPSAPAAAAADIIHEQLLSRAHLPPATVCAKIIEMSLGQECKKIETEYWKESISRAHDMAMVTVVESNGSKYHVLRKNKDEWTSKIVNILHLNCALLDGAGGRREYKIVVATTMNSIYFVRLPIKSEQITHEQLAAKSAEDGYDDDEEEDLMFSQKLR